MTKRTKEEKETSPTDAEGAPLLKDRMAINVPAKVHAEIKVLGALYQIDISEMVTRLWTGFALELEKQLIAERKLGKPRRMENGFIVD